MEEKTLKLCQNNDLKGLQQLIEHLRSDEILQLILKFMESDFTETPTLLKGIFEDRIKRKSMEDVVALFIEVFNTLNEKEISQKASTDIISYLLMEVDHLSVKSLVKLVDYFVSAIRCHKIENGKSLELLPKILTILSSSKSIQFEDDGEMTGEDYKSHILNTICLCRWSPKVAVQIASMLRDIDLTSEELSFVVKKLRRILTEIDLQSVPPLCYQILLLSSKGQKRLIIDGICSFLNESDGALLSEADTSLRHAKGTIIIHVTFAVKQDQDLGREFLKYMKSVQNGNEYERFTSFNVSLALAISTIRRLEDGIFEYLKNMILKAYKEEDRRNSSFWFHEICKQHCDVDDVITSVLEYSKHGWDDVVQGMTHFGFMLLDSYVSKQNDLFEIQKPATAAQKLASLGGKILECLFKDHDFLREEIISHILNTIATRSQMNNSHVIDILSSLAASIPQVMLDCLPKIKEVFDYISLLTPNIAEGILHAILPLMKISMTMKDSLILVLRKAMFSRQEESRKIAVTGLLLIVKHFKIPVESGSMVCNSQFASTQLYSCSQVDIPSSSRNSSTANESLCMEIMGNLRRCLTHQHDVRLHLYEGMYEVVSKNPMLTYRVLDLLYNQFKRYYESNEDIPAPLKLEMCISLTGGQVTATEPLSSLLNCLQLCTTKSGIKLEKDEDEDESLSHLLDEIEEIFTSMTRRMIKADLEDFELERIILGLDNGHVTTASEHLPPRPSGNLTGFMDKSANFNTSSSVGLKNFIYANIVYQVYEVLIEYNWMAGNFSEQSANDIIKLFENRQKVIELLADKNVSGKRGKSSAPSTIQGPSFLSLKFLTNSLQATFCDTVSEHEKGLQPLREKLTFLRFLVNSVLQKLNQILETKKCEGPGGQNPQHIVKQLSSLGRTFLFQINGDTCLPEDLVHKNKSQKFTSTCLEGLQLIVYIICNHFKNDLTRFLGSVEFSANYLTQNGNDEGDAEEDIIYRHLKRFQRMILNIFVSPDDEIRMKESQVLISIMGKLIEQLDSSKVSQVYTWLLQVSAEHNLEDSSVVKSLLSLLLTLHRKSKTSTNLVREIAQDIHSQLGDIDEEIEVENRAHYSIINAKTVAPHVFLLLLNHIDRLLDENEWILAKLRADTPTQLNNESAKDDKENYEEIESESEKTEELICHKTIGLVTAFHELVQSAFPEGTAADTITKTLTKLYGFLSSFAKYHLNLYNQKNGHMTLKFEKLVRLTGTHLAQQTYAMITYMQATQNMADESMQNRIRKSSANRQNAAKKLRAIKESKMIPNLIYAIEQYERYLIQLSKKSKVTNLMEHFKLSTSRDFRINGATLEAALHEAIHDGEEQHEESSENSRSNDEPLSKRTKLAKSK